MATPQRRTWTLRAPLLIGIGAVVLLVTVLLGWGMGTRIAGAVIGNGKIEVATTLTVVQHPLGGVVAEVLVTNGDSVTVGDVLIRLDDRALRSDLAAAEGELFETLANIARLEAILDDQTTLTPNSLLAEAAQTRPAVQALIDRQQRRLDAHIEAIATRTGLIEEQIAQVRDQIVGIEAELEAKIGRGTLLREEIANQEKLAERGLSVRTTMFDLQKDEMMNKGEVGQLTARVAELQGRIAELKLGAHTLLPDLKDEAETELSRLRPLRTTLLERRSQLLADLDRTEVRAPVSGRVHDSQVQGVQSVVVAASPLMSIVPADSPFLVGVRVDAGDIEQIHQGQPAYLRFTGLGSRRVPDIEGQVASVSPAAFVDPATRRAFYEVRIRLDHDQIERLGDAELLPGMPVTAFMTTDSRTPLSYATRPLIFYFERAFRDS
jgi:HlyD family secretion protein